MLVVHKRPFYTGLVMALGFAFIMLGMFLPIVRGKTPLQAADDFFNSISKHSSYYIPELREHAQAYKAVPLDMKLTLPDADLAAKAAVVFSADGAQASASGAVITLRGQLGGMLSAALEDADALFNNRGEAAASKYRLDAKEVMYARWLTLKQVYKQLRSAGEFKRASAVEEVLSKGVEVSYNFYGIAPSPVSANVGILSLALVFYLVYTMWWGYAIMWLCDGIGLQMKSSGKREH